MSSEKWSTSITKIEPNKVQVRGYKVDELIQKSSFAEVIFLILKGELPDKRQKRMMEAIFVSSIDHGVTPPSALAARTVASTGAPFNAALASGILAIADFHGGAIEKCMIFLKQAVEKKKQENKTTAQTAAVLVREALEKKQTLHGYGHRFHTEDPRTTCLLEIARDSDYFGEHVEMALAVKDFFHKEKGKVLELNVDGAIASLLCEMGFTPELGNAFFVIARTPGLVAHVHEERTTQKKMRRIEPGAYYYAGPEDRVI